MSFYELGSDELTISVNDLGAELSSVRDRQGRELLWQGGEAWGRRAPILFPIVGRLPGNQLLSGGDSFRMTQHGFARDQPFVVEQSNESSCLFTLTDNPETMAQFPFLFRLQVRYTVIGDTVEVQTTVTNPGERTLSASLGEHPGFQWPLPGAASRDGHAIEFAVDEPAPIRRIDANGLLAPEPFPTPVVGRTLALDDSLFADDAVIFDQLSSRSVRYTAPGAPTISLAFPDFPLLGVWTNPPGRYVCIEPWFGMTSPAGFDGDFREKPGQFALNPGESRVFVYRIAVTP
ncbi:MAG: aldose 1-epimerase [Microbacteriaceae bacterium]|nr:aldose 1-epimerase [Microbacteriaceae bacterium]